MVVESTRRFAPISTFEVARLRDSLDDSRLIFDRQLRDRSWSPTLGTEPLTSTAIALIGLSRAGVSAREIGLDPSRTWSALVRLARERRYPGALGLLLWADAVGGGPGPAEVVGVVGGPIRRVGSLAPGLRTLELAWLLAGLLHQHHRAASGDLESAIDATKAALLARFEPRTGMFRHADADSPLPLRLRRWVATFADQVYPIQALALAAIALGDRRALQVASESAVRLADLQGSLGQWWWHYDPRDGSVSGAYPVYSVHQFGMAPMALRTLAIAGGPDLDRSIDAGRAWISANELGVDLLDREAGTTWRSIERAEGRPRRVVRHAKAVLGGWDDRPARTPPRLRINHETRPYEWAWSLFASAIEAGLKVPEHLA